MLIELMEVKAITSTRVKKTKHSFNELIAKYQKLVEINITNGSRKV
jgi:hypothetical protein